MHAIEAAIRVAEEAWAELRRTVRDRDDRAASWRPNWTTGCGWQGPTGRRSRRFVAVDASARCRTHRPGDRRLRRGSVLLVDFGARWPDTCPT